MGASALALIIANSPLRPNYETILHVHVGPLSVGH